MLETRRFNKAGAVNTSLTVYEIHAFVFPKLENNNQQVGGGGREGTSIRVLNLKGLLEVN